MQYNQNETNSMNPVLLYLVEELQSVEVKKQSTVPSPFYTKAKPLLRIPANVLCACSLYKIKLGFVLAHEKFSYIAFFL